MYGMPEVNRATILYLARFFNQVVSFSEFNKMNSYNVAVIITPNIFRSRQITSKDLMNHGTLSDVFTLIMGNVDCIV
jgi:RhoGAP domain